ncbi:hypothetical protein ACWDBD_44740 [Streptomyces sp. NPDC001118]
MPVDPAAAPGNSKIPDRVKASGPGQGLRPFRDPDAVEDDEG